MKLNNEISAPVGNDVIIVFTRNPELGKVKSRLAKVIGQQAALNIYIQLLEHTEKVLRSLTCDVAVYYSNQIESEDLWNKPSYKKYLQCGEDLGERMRNAFHSQFELKYQKVVIVGSDLFDLKAQHINDAFKALEQNDVVIGPAKDGGYYLLGMTSLKPELFENKNWGTSTVFQDTLKNLQSHKVEILETLSDIDTFEDLEAYPTIINQINKKINEELY